MITASILALIPLVKALLVGAVVFLLVITLLVIMLALCQSKAGPLRPC